MTIKELIEKLIEYNDSDLPVGVKYTEISGGGSWTGIDVDTGISDIQRTKLVKGDELGGRSDIERADHIELILEYGD